MHKRLQHRDHLLPETPAASTMDEPSDSTHLVVTPWSWQVIEVHLFVPFGAGGEKALPFVILVMIEDAQHLTRQRRLDHLVLVQSIERLPQAHGQLGHDLA